MTPLRTLAALLLTAVSVAAAAPLQSLKVSADHRYLIKADGSPFFFLGDTAWELFHRLKGDDLDKYLADRAGKGFTVIQAVALAEFDGLTLPNAYGHLPLENNDPTKPVEAYFQDIDLAVRKAAALGMYVGLLPTWGDKINKKWGQGPEIFTPENARVFGEYLGKRYKDQPIIWILGGDRPVENPRHLAIFNAMAEGLKAGDGGRHLMTYHPMGGNSSSKYVHAEPWLDFNMMQSGHGQKNMANYKMIAADLALTPPKPTMDGEPCYDDHPVREKKREGWFDETDVRKLGYWGVLAGACGHTYGAHPIWGFWDGKSKPLSDPRHSWTEALEFPGSRQIGYLRRVVESRPYLTRIPDQSLLVSAPGEGADHLQAARDSAGTYAFIYTPKSKPFTLDLTKLAPKTLRATWFNPRDATAQSAGDIPTGPAIDFTPPAADPAADWLLVLDDPAKNYPPPGAVSLGK